MSNNLKMRVCVRNITRFNEKWFNLPISDQELNEFLHNGNHEYIIVDHELPFECSEYANITELNEIYEQLTELNFDITEIKALFKFADNTKETLQDIINGDYDILEITDKNKLLDESDFAWELYKNEYYLKHIGIIPENLIDYIEWEVVWRDYEIGEGWREVIINEDDYRQFLVRI
jgi:hypothetical protein